MIAVRSLLFNVAFWLWSLILTIAALAVFWAPQSWTLALGRLWCQGTLTLARSICGLGYEVRGRVPDPPVIVASKHQSAWDTFIFPILLGNPAYVLKRELLWIPLLGLCLWRAGHIAVDRKGGGPALRRMLHRARAVAAEGRSIVIYPEGTRTAPGSRRPYHPGVLALYTQLKLPIVPVALNSGLYWGRRSFLKRPGRIVIEFLEPIQPGTDRRRLLSELERRIETASDRLVREAGAGTE